MIIKKHRKKVQTLSRYIIAGLMISFLVSFGLLSNNAHAISIFKSDYDTMLQLTLSSSNTTNVSIPLDHSQMSHMNMNMNMNMNINQTEMMKRGDIGMGFNQTEISHQFVITPNGGKIIVTALDNNDTQTIGQIKNHINDIQKLFSEGNFTIPFFVHAEKVLGTDVMKNKKDLIDYSIAELKNGSSLILTTNDKEVVDAISQFMKFQATEHKGH
jgi:hypothetical protein